MQLQRLPRVYPYPYLLPGIRIFRISRETHRVATSSHRLQLRAVEDVPTSNLSLRTSRPASTILLKVIVLRVALCNMRKKYNISGSLTFLNPPSHMYQNLLDSCGMLRVHA